MQYFHKGSCKTFTLLECCVRQGEQSMKLSIPDLILVGHEEVAAFALGMSSAQPLVASGGEDKKVGECLCSSYGELTASCYGAC
jgi:hypothetical protein